MASLTLDNDQILALVRPIPLTLLPLLFGSIAAGKPTATQSDKSMMTLALIVMGVNQCVKWPVISLIGASTAPFGWGLPCHFDRGIE